MITKNDLIELPANLQNLFAKYLDSLKACQSHHLELYIGPHVFMIEDGYLTDNYFHYNEKDENDDNYYDLRNTVETPYFRRVYKAVRQEFLKYESELFLELHGDY